MKKMLIVLALTFASPVFAAPPSDASLRQLLEITNSKKLFESAVASVDAEAKAMTQQILKGKEITAADQEALDRMNARLVAMMQEEMRWQTLEPRYLDIYRESFTQAEVDGMLRFYKSPTGKAVIEKMPVVMQHTMQLMQGLMVGMAPKLQAIIEDMLVELQANRRQPAQQP